MAVSWKLEPTVINFDRREVRVGATRTDDTPEPNDVRRYSVTGKVDTAQNKQRLLDAIYRKYEQEVVAEGHLATVVADMVAAGEANLNARDA